MPDSPLEALDPPFSGDSGSPTQDSIFDYRNEEQNYADQFSQNRAQTADQELTKFNEHTKRITSKPMGKDCAQCQKGYQQMTIDKLRTNAKVTYGTETEADFADILGFSQSKKTEIGATEVSGNYYYLDKNQNWIWVHANKAFKGNSGKAEVSGGPDADVGLFSGKAQAPMSSEVETPSDAGLPRP